MGIERIKAPSSSLQGFSFQQAKNNELGSFRTTERVEITNSNELDGIEEVKEDLIAISLPCFATGFIPSNLLFPGFRTSWNFKSKGVRSYVTEIDSHFRISMAFGSHKVHDAL